jgi:hypothetical protein
MILSGIPSPAEAGSAKAENRFHPRIKSEGGLFRDHAPSTGARRGRQ